MEGEEMALEIKLLNLIDIELDSSFLVLGGEDPIMVDTGAKSAEIMHRLGMEGWIAEEQVLATQLANFGLAPKDVRWVLHTHLHIDHAGQDDRFPDSTTVNHSTTKRQEKAAIKKALQNTFVLPVHDYPARVHAGRIVARLGASVPGPEETVTMRCPSETGIVVGAEVAEPVSI